MDLEAETGAVVNGRSLKFLLARLGETKVGLWATFSNTYIEVKIWRKHLILICVK